MHNLVVSCLVVAYLSANVYAIVKVRVTLTIGRASSFQSNFLYRR
jgi:hypothetical protein